jgi:hypothetical protein
MIRESKTVSELVINGDLMDEWVVPMDYEITSLSDFDDAIVANNGTLSKRSTQSSPTAASKLHIFPETMI